MVPTLLLALAACSATEPQVPAAPRTSAAASPTPTPLASFDAPREFDGTPVPIALDGVSTNVAGDFTSRFTLHGERVYALTPAGVGAADLATGATLWETPFPGNRGQRLELFYSELGPRAPVVSDDGGTAYAAVAVLVEGSGTQKDTIAVQLLAVDAATGDVAWSTDVPTVSDDVTTQDLTGATVAVEAVDERHVLLSGPGDLLAAVDVATHDVVWSVSGSLEHAGADVLVVDREIEGIPYRQLAGVDRATGEQLWVGGDDQHTSAGLVAVETPVGVVGTKYWYLGGEPVTGVLDVTTGQLVQELPGVVLANPRLEGDLLLDLTSSEVRVLDPTTFEVRWELPTADRESLRRPTTFGGMVYGGVGDGTSVVLDGATGQDVTVDVDGKIIAVGEHGALVLRDQAVLFLPATA